MNLLTFIVFTCFNMVIGIQPLQDGMGGTLPPLVITTDKVPNVKEENKKKEEDQTKEFEKAILKEESGKQVENIEEEKTILPLSSPSNSTLSEPFDFVKWFEEGRARILGRTGGSDSKDSLSHIETPSKPQENGDDSLISEHKLNNSKVSALDDKSIPQTDNVEDRSVTAEKSSGSLERKTVSLTSQAIKIFKSNQSQVYSLDNKRVFASNQTNSVAVIEESGPASSCKDNPYGSVCTYVLALAIPLYLKDMWQSFHEISYFQV